MSTPESINKFADRVEALSVSLGLNGAEFTHVLSYLIHKKHFEVTKKEEMLRRAGV